MVDQPNTGEAPIVVVPYDPSWLDRFTSERDVLARTIGPYLIGSIEHIGSTAIPGLAAKPVIDMMAGVESLDASRPAIEILGGIGYCYFPYQPDRKHWFCKPSPAFRTHHLHLVPYGSPSWRDSIEFRDYLRSHPSTAAEYQQLKYALAERYRDDREAYTEAKGPFVAHTLQLARQ